MVAAAGVADVGNYILNHTHMKLVSKRTIVILLLIGFAVPWFAGAQTTPPNNSLFAATINIFQSELTTIYDAALKILSAVSNSAAPAANTPVSATSVSNFINLKVGSRGVLVSSLQNALAREGYLKEAPTGVFDGATQAALEAAQKAKQIPVTGEIVMATSSVVASLEDVAPPFTPVELGATGSEATAIQKFFIARGYLKIATSTGYFGVTTQAAIEAFQKAHGLPQTGIIDVATFAAMNGK